MDPELDTTNPTPEAGATPPAETTDTGTPAPDAGGATPAEASAPADETPAGEGAAAAPVDPAAAPAKPSEDWKAKKFDKTYARLKEVEAELARVKGAPAEDPAAAAARLDESEIERRAAARLAQVEFNKKCNEVVVEARKTYTDFDSALGNLQKLVTPGDAAEVAAYSRLVEAAVETGAAGRLLYELGGNLDEAQRIMALSPVRQAIELARMAEKKGEAEPSRAPKPITPVGQRGATSQEIKPEDPVRADKLSGKEWIERRQKNIDARRANGERVW